MKKSFLFILGMSNLLGALNASATIDSNARVYIVAQHVQTEEYFIERVPVVGCYGLARGPELAQFTAPYQVPYNMGCGGEPRGTENINALSCATRVSEKESSDYSTFSELTLDITQCPGKNDPKFITMIRTAAKLNFPQTDKHKEINLTLIK